jgi:predicted house-cleaning NTP pyrophosphatase (Maf/HAM1 superfamily)
MTTEWLNSVMVLNVHKDMLYKPDDATTVDEFVAQNERRTHIFNDGIGLLSIGIRHYVVSECQTVNVHVLTISARSLIILSLF